MAVEIMNVEAGATLDVIVEHKNDDDTAWAPLANFPTMNAVSVESIVVSGFKPQVRYQYMIGGGPAGFCHIYVYDPTWRD